MAGREELSIPGFDDDLDDFAPRRSGGADVAQSMPSASEVRRSVDAVSQFPTRDPAQIVQLNLKGPRPIFDRFRAMCKADRRAYYDMLEILMDAYEGKHK